jgi:hypothetical protein
MSVALVASTGAYSAAAGTTITTAPIDCSAANFLVVVAGYYAGGPPSGTLTDSASNTWTLAAGESASNKIALFYAVSPAVSTSQTFTYSSINAPCWILVLGFSGAESNSSPTVALTNSVNNANFNAAPANGGWQVYTPSLIISAVSVESSSASYPTVITPFSAAADAQSPDFHPFSNYLSAVAAWEVINGSVDAAWSLVSGTGWDGLNVAFALGPIGETSSAFLA